MRLAGPDRHRCRLLRELANKERRPRGARPRHSKLPASSTWHSLLHVAQLDGDASLVPALTTLVARQRCAGRRSSPRGYSCSRARPAASARPPKREQPSASSRRSRRERSRSRRRPISCCSSSSWRWKARRRFRLEADRRAGLQRSSRRRAARRSLLARKFGPKSAPVADVLWPGVLNPQTKAAAAADYLATIAAIERPASAEKWQTLLTSGNPLWRTEAVRWWRHFKGQPAMVDFLVRQAPDLVKRRRRAARRPRRGLPPSRGEARHRPIAGRERQGRPDPHDARRPGEDPRQAAIHPRRARQTGLRAHRLHQVPHHRDADDAARPVAQGGRGAEDRLPHRICALPVQGHQDRLRGRRPSSPRTAEPSAGWSRRRAACCAC